MTKEQLFSIYSKNLSIYFPEVKDLFVCPLCCQVFGKADMEQRLSRAHVLPKSLGGRMVTLSCKECDNRAGRYFNVHAKKEKNVNEWSLGRAPMDSRFVCGENSMGVEVRRNGTNFELREIAKQTNPTERKHILFTIQKGKAFRSSLRFASFNESLACLSYVHSAYLMLFRYFGYEYARMHEIGPFRQALHRAIWGHPFPVDLEKMVIPLSNLYPNIPRDIPSLSFLVQPAEYQCFLIGFPSPNANEEARGVLMPGFSGEPFALYERLRIGPDQFDTEFVLITENPFAWLTNPTRKAIGHRTWRNLVNSEPRQ